MKRHHEKISQSSKRSKNPKLFEVSIKHKKYSTVELFAGAGG